MIPTFVLDKRPASGGLHVEILREPFSDYVTLKLDNGHSEDLDADETRAWFRVRGANMPVIESALDYVFNFNHADVYIKNPIEPILGNPRLTPRL